MRDVNRVTLLGRLGADPIRRETQTGNPFVTFSMATSRRYRVGPDASTEDEVQEIAAVEWAEETQWHKVVVWGKQAETCAHYLKKGNPVYVEGSLKSRKFEDKEGIERFTFEVHADSFSFLSSPKPAELKLA